MDEYNHKDIESKWQKKWEEENLYETPDNPDPANAKYVLGMFPYPSGSGLHVGHVESFAGTDVYARFQRMQGKDVLFPMGWDAFGLPAENYAIKTGTHPRERTEETIPVFKDQLQSLGFSYDWNREINTSQPEYYQWTQKLFTTLFEEGLAEKKPDTVNWCPSCQTVLANAQVVDDLCERCDTEVEQKEMDQWFFNTTAYADELIDDLDDLDWPESTKELQRNWIGRKVGARFEFEISPGENDESLEVFTTRPDTLFGVTFLVLAPEHRAISNFQFLISNEKEVREYVEQTKEKSDKERQEAEDKTGVKLEGVTAKHPATGENLPVFVADYVLPDYGTGAIMAVPAHDERDFEFAKQHEDEIKASLKPEFGKRRENEERSDGGVGVIFSEKRQKYAVAESPTGEYRLFGGGAEGEETLEQAAWREIAEESGFDNFSHKAVVGECVAHYYNPVKESAKAASSVCVLGVLNDEEQNETDRESHEDYNIVWKTPEEILDNWHSRNEDNDYDHSIWQLKRAVNKAIELGVDNTHSRFSDTHGVIRQVVAKDKQDNLWSKQKDFIKKIFTTTDSKGKSAFLSGGWALEMVTSNFIRNHKDIDLCVAHEDTSWWKDWLQGEGFSIQPVEDKDEQYRFQATKDDLEIDVFGVGKEGDKLFDMEWGEPDEWQISTKAIKETSFEDVLVRHLSKQAVIKLQYSDSEKNRYDQFMAGMSSWSEKGHLINSSEFSGLDSDTAAENITEQFGEKETTYKLQDWSIGRQRYWGAPIPIVYDPDGQPHPVPDEHLPWELPDDVPFEPTGEPPLAKSEELQNRVEEIFGEGWTPETETMDTFVDSSWYFLRYPDPDNDETFARQEALKTWCPVDMYIGGAEHAVLHLLYARFITKALADAGKLDFREPFASLRHQGMVLAEDGTKMSKSKGNVVNPNKVVDQVGADTLRMYELFAGPFAESFDWDTDAIAGPRRFIERAWRLFGEHEPQLQAVKQPPEGDALMHQTTRSVTEDIADFKFNTALSSLMEARNELEKRDQVSADSLSVFIRLLSPFAPHVAEELWHQYDGEGSVHEKAWPEYSSEEAEEDTVDIAIQIDGTVRGEMTIDKNTDEDAVIEQAKEVENVRSRLEDTTITRHIYVPEKLVNFVTEE